MNDKYCTKHGEPAYEPCECIDFCEEEAANAASAAEIDRLSKEKNELREALRVLRVEAQRFYLNINTSAGVTDSKIVAAIQQSFDVLNTEQS